MWPEPDSQFLPQVGFEQRGDALPVAAGLQKRGNAPRGGVPAKRALAALGDEGHRPQAAAPKQAIERRGLAGALGQSDYGHVAHRDTHLAPAAHFVAQ